MEFGDTDELIELLWQKPQPLTQLRRTSVSAEAYGEWPFAGKHGWVIPITKLGFNLVKLVSNWLTQLLKKSGMRCYFSGR
jgi:hypothetical protein